MKCHIYLIALFLFTTITPCKSQLKEKSRINHTTPICPNTSTRKIGENYTDNLEYLFYNPSEHSGQIQELPLGRLFKIKWEIQRFFEQGESGETYFAESLESFKLLKSPLLEVILYFKNH